MLQMIFYNISKRYTFILKPQPNKNASIKKIRIAAIIHLKIDFPH